MGSLPRRQSVRSRGQSSLIGLVLVFGMVLAGTVTVVVLGAGAIEDTQEQVSQERTEKAMTQFDSKVALVALGNTDVQQVSFGQDRTNNYDVEEGTGWMRVNIENQTDGSTSTLLNESLGAVTTENGDTTLAYQGGGVWRTGGGNASVMVSPPEFHFRNGTLTLPVVNVTGAEQLGDRVSISNRETVTKYPNASAGDENPLSEHKIVLTVKSEYYQAWGSYFETRTDGVVDYDHDRKIANLTLKTPAGKRTVSNALAGTAGSGTLKVKGNGAKTDSYNSSVDEYSNSQSDNGNITVAGTFEATGGATIDGNVRSGDFECSGNSDVNGRVDWANSYTESGACTVTDGDDQISDVDGPTAINDYVDSTVDDLSGSNDNTGTPADGGTITFSGATATLTAGDYSLDRLEIGSSEELTLDTSGGNIRIGVSEYVDLADGAKITVQGNGQVKLFVKGDATNTNGNHFEMEGSGGDNAKIETAGAIENSTQFWVYGRSDMKAKIDSTGGGANNAILEGVIYAPGGPSGSGEVVNDGGEVFGGIVAPTATVGNSQGSEVHFDEALADEQAIPKDTKVVTITYLHVSVSRVEVS